jgi:hypothetical protein
LTSDRRHGAALFVFFLSLFLLTSDFVLRTSPSVKAQPQVGAVPTPPSIPISPPRSAAFGAVIVATINISHKSNRGKTFFM